jgi:hypothetical protein
MYRTAHFDDLPHPSSLPIDPLAKRLLDLALNSVQTLHLTLPKRESTHGTFPLGTSPPRVTYDVRTVGKSGLDATDWPAMMYGFNPDNWPNVQSIIQTSSEEMKGWLEEEVEEENRWRVEIRLEDKAEGDAMLAEMRFWRGGGL